MTEYKIIGVTGTRSGMIDDQLRRFAEFLEELTEQGATEFHHGDCVGVDEQAAIMAQGMGLRTICHPPLKEDLRAFHKSDEIREQQNHFARNRSIVDNVDLLIVVPWQDEWQPRGGTWYTHDYAEKVGVETFTVWPSPTVHQLILQGR